MSTQAIWARSYSRAIAAILAGIAAIIAAAIGLRLAGYLYWPVYLMLAASTLLAALASGRWLQFHLASSPRLRSTLQGLWVSAFTLALLFLIMEAVFRIFVARTDGLGISLANLNWFRRYWKPINSLGYRDDEWTVASLQGRVKILTLGDSFASGNGIVDYQERLSNVLGSELGPQYASMLAAKPAWSSIDEYKALEEYPYPPDIVIVTYYINDIDPAALSHGLMVDNPVPATKSPFFPLIESSYLLNFIYFQGLRLPYFHASDTYLAYLEKAYQTPEIWDDHQGQLMAFYHWTQAHNARLVVVIFPSLLKPDETAFATQKVAGTFNGLDNVSVIDLTPDLLGEDPQQNIVNSLDPHPSISLHHRVADDLCGAIAAMPGLPAVACPSAQGP